MTRHLASRALSSLRLRRTVTVVGAFRSGTNVIARILGAQPGVTVAYNTFGWKHGYLSSHRMVPLRRLPRHRIVSVSKDPFAFVESFYRYVREREMNVAAPKDWEDFVTNPLEVFDQSEHTPTRIRYESPIHYWNAIYAHHLLLPERCFDVIHVRYDDLLNDTDATMRTVLTKLGRPLLDAPISLPVRAIPPSESHNVAKRETGSSFDGGWHRERGYLDRFTDRQSGYVSGAVDPWVADRLGYGDVLEWGGDRRTAAVQASA